MSTAQVTEAHLDLAKNIIFSRDASGRLLTASMAAQLIADSEARAISSLAMVTAESADRNVSLRLENDQLRAEVKSCGELSCDECNARTAALTNRAERAEAEVARLKADGAASAFVNMACRAADAEAKLHALRLVCGTTDADKFSTWVDRANARAERAEAELADHKTALEIANRSADEQMRYKREAEAERDALAKERARLDWLETPSGMDWQWEPERLTVSRASIDAAMKEGAK